jgi:hypothetical protein
MRVHEGLHANPPVRASAPPVRRATEHALLRLQRTHGNRYVQRLVADGEVEQGIEGARGAGRPLDAGVRGRMETAFGANFSAVRVHTGAEAHGLSRALSARAFTTGTDVFFADGEYAPESSAGRGLIAHELTHVVQQAGGIRTRLVVGPAGDEYEEEAEEIARTVAGGDFKSTGGAPPRDEAETDQKRGVGGFLGGVRGRIGGVTATVPANVRAANTPAAMTDRIPPRVDTPVAVTVGGNTKVGGMVTLSIGGASAANGRATINGSATASVAAGGTVQIRGTTQTTPGNGGNLRLQAHSGGRLLGQSAGFSVAAIPQDYTDTFLNDVADPAKRGIVVQDGWVSDSGTLADLDQVQIAEVVETTAATGCYSGVGVNTSPYLPGASFTADTHSSAVSTIQAGPGTRVADQACKFKDARTGANDIPMRNSGFRLTRVVTVPSPGHFQLDISKVGAAVSPSGVTTGAGVCNVSKTYTVP